MGKLTLLLVLAAVLGGSLLTLNSRLMTGATENGHRNRQADLLVREIATSGHAVVLAAITGPDGFDTPAIPVRELDGGTYRVEYEPATAPDRVTFTVEGTYRGASHRIESTYEWDPMDYPGPIWLDVPYATAAIAPGAAVSGGAESLQVQFDRRQHDELRLGEVLPLSQIESGLSSAFAPTSAGYESGRSGASWDNLLQDLNVTSAEDLYQAALLQAPETVFTGDQTLTSNLNKVGGPGEVTHVDGALTVQAGGRLRGEGALVVGGSLTVEVGGRMEWEGIVIVRAEQQFLPVRLDGRVSIEGGLVVAQQAYPPGGHMDVTVWRDLASGLSASNVRGEAPRAPWPANKAWTHHQHRFDGAFGTKAIRFLESGGAVYPQEQRTIFGSTIAALGNEEVYLETANEDKHGYAAYTLGVDGATYRGSIRTGYGDFALEDNPFRTQPFRASDLDDLTVEVRSLQALRRAFNDASCEDYPMCIGASWDRLGALRLRVRRASDDAILYEVSPYWHMRSEEWDAYKAAEAAWRAQIESGGLFGTQLSLGPNASVTFDSDPVFALVDRLGFDGNEVLHMSTTVDHRTFEEGLALATRPDGDIEVCHKVGTPAEQTQVVKPKQVARHLNHGDAFVACDGTPASGGTAASPVPQVPPACPDPNALVAICNKPGRNGLWRDRTVKCSDVANHLAHGCMVGSCAANSPSTPIPTEDTALVPICHIDGPSRATMFVEVADLAIHLAHSDLRGQCP